MKTIIFAILLGLTFQTNAQNTARQAVKDLEKLSPAMNSSEEDFNRFQSNKTKSIKHRRGDTFKCESNRNQREHCYADTSGGVRIKQDLSYNRCRGNWGYDYYGVWVTNGCRAEFTTDLYQSHWGNDYRNDDFIRCESYGMRRNSCRVGNLQNAQVSLIHQLSRYNCQGNWGNNNNEIWVSNGCKADFRISRSNNNYPGGDYNGNDYGSDLDSLTCISNGSYVEYCAVPELEHVELVEVLNSRENACRGNWGYDPRGIWVKNGCQARFGFQEYQYESYEEVNNNQSTYFDIKCKSRSNQVKICNAKNFDRVEFKREISKGKYPCKGNWGVNRYGELFVKSNCYAEFRIWR